MTKAKQVLPQIHIVQGDVSSPEGIIELHKKVTSSFPALNILINNAGIMKAINLRTPGADLKILTEEIQTNLIGAIQMTSQFLPHLLSKSQAAVVNVSAGLAFVPLPVSPVYCATKAALHSYTQSLRVQLKGTSVKVFELAPPATATEMLGYPNSEDLKGINVMPVEALAAAAIKGLAADKFEIRPGDSNGLKFLSRLAPEFILKKLSRSTDRMIKQSTH